VQLRLILGQASVAHFHVSELALAAFPSRIAKSILCLTERQQIDENFL
jgi:hypothetical protein